MKLVPLSGAKGAGLFTQVDDEDWESVSRWSWSLGVQGYPQRGTYRNGRHQTELLHWFLDYRWVDHRDRDKLNNQRSNLRLATDGQNRQNQGLRSDNTSGYRGVSWDKRNGKWRASAMLNRRCRNLGRFVRLSDAIQATVEFRRIHMPFSEDANV